MRRTAVFFILFFFAIPVLPSPPVVVSVQTLIDQVKAARKTGTSDGDLALKLSQLELSEELTAGNSIAILDLLPGPLSKEQLYVLEIRSAILPPPASDLPNLTQPDETARQAMLKRAETYVAGTFAQLPPLTAQHLVARFQDGMEAVPDPRRGQQGVSDRGSPNPGIRLINRHLDTGEVNAGVEKSTVFTETRLDAPNDTRVSIDTPLSLPTVISDAVASETLKFVRWQTVQGRILAVFSFAVEKRKSGLELVYHQRTVQQKVVSTEPQIGGDVGYDGVTSTTVGHEVWLDFKHRQVYSGTLFLQSETGVVFRVITEVNFQPGDILHRQTVRTDYAAVSVSGAIRVVPIHIFTATDFVIYDAKSWAKSPVRQNFVTEDFTDYKFGTAQTTP